MKSSIRTFAARFIIMVVLFAPAGAFQAQGASQPTSLCPPSFRMTEHDGCQPSNGSKSGSSPAHVKDDTAEQLRKEAELAFALIYNTPSEIRSCVWTGSHDNWTQDKARAAISRCERDVQIRRTNICVACDVDLFFRHLIANAVFLMPWIACILMLALAIGFRARIAAALYYLFVSWLALRLRFNRTRKRFLDNAIKEAENRLGS